MGRKALEIHSSMNKQRAHTYNGKALDLYSGGAPFEPRAEGELGFIIDFLSPFEQIPA
jgi:hypothetical protein